MAARAGPTTTAGATPPDPPFPALYLLPLDGSFYPPKRIFLPPPADGGAISKAGPPEKDRVVRIGRQLNAKAQPTAANGVFESRVLSRVHAEVWVEFVYGEGDKENAGSQREGGLRVLIRDVKSSNGTFVNGERLAPEGVESAPCEVRSDDILEFGIDIIGEHGEVVHRKVSARATCALTEAEASRAVRTEQRVYPPASPPSPSSPSPAPTPPPSTGPVVTFAEPANRRPQHQSTNSFGSPGSSGANASGIAGMGGMGTERIRPKSGDFESILARLRDGPRAAVAAHATLDNENAKANDKLADKENVSEVVAESILALKPMPATTTTTAIDALTSEVADTRLQLDGALVSASLFMTPPPSATEPRILANASFLAAELTKLREEAGALQRAKTGARSRRRRRREEERMAVAAESPIEDDGWEDLGFDMPAMELASPSGTVPDSPLAFEHQVPGRKKEEEEKEAVGNAKRQLDALEAQLHLLQDGLRAMQTGHAQETAVVEPELDGLVKRVDRLEEALASPQVLVPSRTQTDVQRIEMETTLRHDMNALQAEWAAFRVEVNDTTTEWQDQDMLGRWLAAGEARSEDDDTSDVEGHSRGVSGSSSASDIAIPGRWRTGGAWGLLTPAGSVRNGHRAAAALPELAPAPTPATEPRPVPNGPIIDHTNRRGIARGDVLLLLGAVGAGAAIVGAAWCGA
ncbi:Monocarboxylate transporter [Mycena indigotica]|uniref:Monocarboxylate transporter n=1 Tax=Mycena indigotica TaxID=2126181 RepID=A0A8H6S1R9_9AGAR|nr:Monocarboxylate transporter [Mycena indigotica]KAF7291334.1 Monocarboxylate transporter [Mycena indigotica]